MGYGDKSQKEKAAASQKAQNDKVKDEQENATWAEDDRKLAKKDKRAEGKAADEADKIRLKAEKAAMEAAEEADMDKAAKAKKKGKQPDGKLTQAQIQRNMALMALGGGAAGGTKKGEKLKKTASVPVEELIPTDADGNLIGNQNLDKDMEATGLEAALDRLQLDAQGKGEKYTYKKFEEEMLDEIKRDNPGLRKNQLTERCWKLWERSNLNPKNQV